LGKFAGSFSSRQPPAASGGSFGGSRVSVELMRRDTLLDFYTDLATAPGEFLVYDDGFRSWHYT
jgi:hypothetical protein